MHPALTSFYESNKDRFNDLRIDMILDNGGYLSIEWCDDCIMIDEITAFMFDDDNEDPSFECDSDSSVCKPNHFEALVEAFAWRLLDTDEWTDFLNTECDCIEYEPSTFGALVWTKAIDLHLEGVEQTVKRLRTERMRLNPTTVSDLPLFK